MAWNSNRVIDKFETMKKLAIMLLAVIPVFGYAQELKSEEIVEYPESVMDEEEEDEVLEIFSVSEQASFPGGEAGLNKFISKNIVYPKQAIDTGAYGTVYVMFIVNQDGSVSELSTIGKKLGFGLEEEALRVIKATSGRWSPAMQRDKAVRMRFRIPIKFQLF